MDFNEMACQKCGGELVQVDANTYRCRYCSSVFQVDTLREQKEALSSLLDEQKQENVANIRFDLWNKTHLPFVEREEISRLAKELKSYLPTDFYGNFYEIASLDSGLQLNRQRLCDFIDSIDANASRDDIRIVLDFLLKSMNATTKTAISNLIERAFKDNDPDLYNAYKKVYEEELYKIENGVYDPSIPRSVYVSYAEPDVDKAMEMVTYLESCNLTCFAAYRNLQRGAGSAHNYSDIIKRAIDNCETIVFLSSNKSRSTEYDALNDLEYIRQTDKKRDKPINRIECIIEEYVGEKQNINEAKIKAFFKELTRTNSPEEVFQRIVYLAQKEMEDEEYDHKKKEPRVQVQQPQPQPMGLTPEMLKMQQQILEGIMSKVGQNAAPQPSEDPSLKEVKYCKYCGMENPIKNRYCSDCGEGAFVATRDEFIKGLKQSREELLEIARKEAAEKERAIRNNTAIYVPSPQAVNESAPATRVYEEQVPPYVSDPRNRAGQGPRNRAGEPPRNRAGEDPRNRAGQAYPSMDDPRNRAGQPPRNHAGDDPRNRAGQGPRNHAGEVRTGPITESASAMAMTPPVISTQSIQVGQRIVIPPEIAKISFRSKYTYKLDGVTVNCCAFLLNAQEKVLGETDFVFFNNLNSLNNSVRLTSDVANATDSINVNLGRVHYDVDRIRLVYAILSEDGRKVNLSMVKTIKLSIYIGDNIYTYDFECNGRDKSIVALDLYKYKNAWKINLVARASGEEISTICKQLGVSVL